MEEPEAADKDTLTIPALPAETDKENVKPLAVFLKVGTCLLRDSYKQAVRAPSLEPSHLRSSLTTDSLNWDALICGYARIAELLLLFTSSSRLCLCFVCMTCLLAGTNPGDWRKDVVQWQLHNVVQDSEHATRGFVQKPCFVCIWSAVNL